MANFTDEYLLENLEQMIMQYIGCVFDLTEKITDMLEERKELKEVLKNKNT